MSTQQKENIESKKHESDKNKTRTVIQVSPELKKILDIQEKVDANSKHKIISVKPLISIQGKPFIFPNTINVIQGKFGSHKSRFASHIASTLLLKDNSPLILGMFRNQNTPITVVYIDTENNLSQQLLERIQRIKIDAGYNIVDDIPNFECISLLDVNIAERLDRFEEFLGYMKKKYSNPILVVIDVMTDCIKNFNNVEESLRFVSILNQVVNEHDVTILGIIHENPNSDANKARGHVGTEITNKATNVVSIAPARESLTLFDLKFIKCRSTEKYPKLSIKFNKVSSQLEFAVQFDLKLERQDKAYTPELCQFLIEELVHGPVDRKELIVKIASEFQCCERTALSRLDDIYTHNRLREWSLKLVLELYPDKKMNRKLYRIEAISPSLNLVA